MTCANGSPPLGIAFGNVTVADGVVARGVRLEIGTPPQVVSLRPSISDDNIWIFNGDDCVNAQDYKCIALNSGVFNSSNSRTYKSTTRNDWNGTGLDWQTTAQANEEIYFNDNIQFGNNGSVYGYPMVMQQPGNSNESSGLGLGPNSTFLNEAVKSGSAPTKAFGFWTGSRSVANPANGAIYIGGYDTSRIDGEFTDFSTFEDCPTCVIVKDITYQSAGGSTSLFSNTSQTITVSLQPFVRWLEIPTEMYSKLQQIAFLQGSFLSNSDGVILFKSGAAMGDLNVTLSNGYNTIIPAQELFFPPRGPDDNGVYSILNDTYQISAFSNTTDPGRYTFDWGIPYLTMNYMIMDYENKKFRMAPARQGPYTQSNGALVSPLCSGIAVSTQAPPNPDAGTTSTPTDTPSGKSTNTGAIAGGVVGGLAGLALLLVLVWYIMRSKKREKALREERDAALAQGSEAGNHHERMSQVTSTSPSEVSHLYTGVPSYHNNNIDSWLHTQPNSPMQQNAQYTAYSPPVEAPSEVKTSATLSGPVEMPAHQYK